MKKAIFVDANHLLSRTFHVPSYQSLSTEIDNKIVFTGATYGFLISLKKIVEKYKTSDNDVLTVVWDGGGKNFRSELSDDYKANRKSKTDEFIYQLHLTKEFLSTMGVMQSQMPNMEADDVIGILSKRARLKGYKVLIISGDKDFNQLVSRFVHVVNPNKGEGKTDKIMTPKVVEETYGVPPNLFADWLSLIGDSADNVSGIDGVGKKTATQLIQCNGTVEDIISANKHYKYGNDGVTKKALSKKMQEKINNAKPAIKLARKLVEILSDINIEIKIDNPQSDFHRLKILFERYSFKSLKFNEYVATFS